MPQKLNIRDQVIELFKAALGQPEESVVQAGKLYRWTLQRGRYEMSMFITIDSPEYTDMAHVMISDGETFQIDPVISITVYTVEEAEKLIERIVRQWKSRTTANG